MDYYFSVSQHVTYDDDEQEGIVYTITEENVNEFLTSVWRNSRAQVKSGGMLVITLKVDDFEEDTN